ncbi:MAG: glycosyltransferase family 2 protein [Candidatus Devosia euplotis]|nr:glycosyltransferase family 2 protein [Candidatus Devosia euplotis]
MSQTVAVITPAFKVQATIIATARSVLAQAHADWQLWIIADDDLDYATMLSAAGIADHRIVHIDSGGIGRGASNARNVELERLDTPYTAILDADDRLKPQKLELAVAALAEHAIVTTELDVMD